jgi:4-amino-4-deoxy-L-arabinose transferase-like glycosyltransferase
MGGATAGRWPGRRARAWTAAAIAGGVALRLLFGLVYWVDKPLTLDEQEYLLLARGIASGRGFVYPAVAGDGAALVHFERPPLYPALIAGVLVVTGHPWASSPAAHSDPVTLPASSSDIPRGLVVVQAMLGAAGAWLVGRIASRVAGARAGVLAALAAAVAPPLVWSSGFALSETLYSALALLTALLLLVVDDGERGLKARRVGFTTLSLALLAGLVAGLAVLTKEGMIVFLPLAGLWLVARRRWVAATVLAVGVTAVLAPWVARNYAVHQRFVLTAAHGGVTFWTGNNPLARGEGDLAANPDMKRARNAIESAHPGASAQEMDAVYYREAWRFIRDRPLDWTVLEVKKLFYTLVPIGPSYLLHSRLYLAGSWLPYCVLVPLAAVGLTRFGRRATRLWAVLLLAASVVIMSLVFFPQERFRIPVIDPALIICAAAVAAPSRAGEPGVPDTL